MYQQRDLTRSIITEVNQDVTGAGRFISRLKWGNDPETYTSHWTERLEVWGMDEDREKPLIRAVISGASGRFTAPPITVETYGSPLDAPWLDRLTRAYQRMGWEYRLVRRPSP